MFAVPVKRFSQMRSVSSRWFSVPCRLPKKTPVARRYCDSDISRAAP